MSANNYILIEEKKTAKNHYFRVSMKDADTGITYGIDTRTFDLQTAIEEAIKIQSEEEVEYGLQVNLLSQKETEEK